MRRTCVDRVLRARVAFSRARAALPLRSQALASRSAPPRARVELSCAGPALPLRSPISGAASSALSARPPARIRR